MTLLLDTRALLWLVADDQRLGPGARQAALRKDAQVSAISIWEIAIKRASGRMRTPSVDELLHTRDFPQLHFTAEHARVAGGLPLHHRDPFARALVAQAKVEGLVLVTADQQLSAYDVALLDATR